MVKWIINVCSVASKKMVELLQDRRWEKRNRTNFYRVMLLVCISSIQFGLIEIFCHRRLCTKTWYSSKSWISTHFGTEIYVWRLDIVQNFSFPIFLENFVSKYIRKYLIQFST